MTNDRLNAIYDKTDGYCHICHKKLAFINYGKRGQKGCWQVEHSISKARGGTDHLNNLYPACIACNLEKGTCHTKTVRRRYETTRAPYCKTKKEQIKQNNMWGIGTAGFIFGARVGGLGGAIIGAIIGSELGRDISR